MSVTASREPGNLRGSAYGGADLPFLAGLIALASLPVCGGPDALAWIPERIAAGEWWRLLTHPFAHLSLYHLALDAGAFLILYHSLRHWGAGRRLLTAGTVACASLAAASLSSDFATRGLCGLSGVAHGLMAAVSVDLIASSAPGSRWPGWLSLGLVIGKSLFEATTGAVFFSDFHFGSVGFPNPYCHLGGALAGALVALLWVFTPTACEGGRRRCREGRW